ncbi:DUF1629 domain-containing protein [Lysobacter pythonis]|uniref:DUF1629 domain-containing protein n=1 Tax=Solilutibacter pythonis TaxID=2483112 RepID=A0A3M2HJ30_9GAMM|nr:DUF1629 domain-containing protein [Lysobacter pythonis]RMH88988.1 DUF1629 domain-containing protein [Lysobacter pythonis]
MTNETAIPVTYDSTHQIGKFYIIQNDIRGGKGHGLEFANEKALRVPGTFRIPSPNGDPKQYSEKPKLIHVPELGAMPRDLESLAGIWIVSERLKQLFESIDPEGFAFVACDFALADGSPGDQRYLCNVVRTLDALDEEASRLKIEKGDFVNGKYYDRSGGANLTFKEESIGSSHIFRTPFALTIFCDHILHDAVMQSKLTGIRFIDAADC